MEAQTLFGTIVVSLSAIAYGFQRAYLKAKSLPTDVPNAKPFYKTSEFWAQLLAAIVGALAIFNGTGGLPKG